MISNNSTYSLQINAGTTLPPALEAWKIYLRDQERSKHTITSFSGDLQLLVNFLPTDKNLGDITTNELNNFLEWVKTGRDQGIACSPKSYARRITSIKSFFRWLFKFHAIATNPAEKILQHSVISPLPEILTPDEMELSLQTARKFATGSLPDSRPYTLLKLLLDTGIKKNECISLNINHIENDQKNPFVFIRYPNPRDRNKERKIRISSEWLNFYETYCQQYKISDLVFPWSARRLEYLLEDISREAGMSKHLSFSMCRWTCAITDYRSGMELERIRQKLGVSKIQWRELKVKLEQLANY